MRLSPLSAEAEIIKRSIWKAFEKTPFPRAIVPVVPVQKDLSLDEAWVLDHLDYRKWAELTLDTMIGIRTDFFWWLTPQAAAYYLPAYLTACLNIREADIMVDHTIDQLAGENIYNEWMNLITLEQGIAILQWLAFMVTEQDKLRRDHHPYKDLSKGITIWVNFGIENLSKASDHAFQSVRRPKVFIEPSTRLKYPETELILDELERSQSNELSPDSLSAFGDSLYYYLTPHGFQYYLPTLLKACLSVRISDKLIPAMIEALTPNSDLEEHFQAMINPLNMTQREMILRFLCLIYTRHSFKLMSYRSCCDALRFWSLLGEST